MVITPQTNIRLLKAPLEAGNLNQLDFASVEEQSAYFLSLPHKEMDDSTYQRKDNIIRYNGNFDDLINYNYVMYQNEAYSDKWFYAFITKMEYINDNTTYVYIKTDVFQTWQFNLTFKQTFVEREHVNNDTVGLHTIPESLELGEMVVNNDSVDMKLSGLDFIICFQVTELLDPMSLSGSGAQVSGLEGMYNGLFSGLYFFAVPDAPNAQKMISAYAGNGKSEAIVAIFYAPRNLLSGSGHEQTYNIPTSGGGYESVTALWFTNTDSATELSGRSIDKPTTVGESSNPYTPRNNKLLTYPYSYLYISNYNGQEGVYHWEDFSGNNAQLSIYGSISQGCSIRLLLNNYKSGNMAHTSSYGLAGGKLPILAWATDYYTNWLTQNAVNIGISYTSSAISAIGNALTGNIGGVVGGLEGIANTMAQQYQAQIIPDQAKGQTNAGDVNFGLEFTGFSPAGMSIRREYAVIIDDYFDRFGYKVNIVKVPNIRGRRNWNYVKTIDCYIGGDIPQDDMNEIKGMFNRGLTIWHNPQNFMDYSQNNDII